MSYVVCSNAENEDEYDNGGFSNPASFANHYKSPLIIEPDSEVAVESVKIDRRSAWTIKETDKFFIYYGPEQNDSGNFTNSGTVTKNGVRIDIRAGSYNKDQMIYELERAINAAPLGPLLFNNCVVAENNDSVTKQFKGFVFTTTSRGSGVNMVNAAQAGDFQLIESHFKPANGAAVKYNTEEANLSYQYEEDATEGTLTCMFDFGTIYPTLGQFTNPNSNVKRLLAPAVSVRHPKGPLSPINGEWVVNFSGATAHAFSLGLSRPNTPFWRYGFPSNNSSPPNAQNNQGNADRRNNFVYNDFWLQWDPTENTGAGALRIYSWGYNDGTGNWTIKEIKYYENPSSGYSAVINATTLGTLNRFKWLIDGNELKLRTLQPDGTSANLVGGTGNEAKKWSFPPLSNTTEALVANIQMVHSEQSMVFEHYTCYDDSGMDNWTYPTGSLGEILDANNYPNLVGTLVPGSDWYSNAELRNNSGGELRYNQLRPSILYANSTTETYTYSNAGANPYIEDYVPVFVMGQENRIAGVEDFDQVLYVIPDPVLNRPNMRRHLGFGTFSVALHSEFGGAEDADNVTSLVSIEAGTYTVHSAFIRVNDLPIQTYNGATSSRSNILYHIPRFSEDGRSFGELYFKVPEKTYLALNNTERITLSQIKIDIVGRSERIVKDLQGATIVCLHIRERHKHSK